ncbi:MAG: hypothetical protein F6J97_10380 [Leptolyngbya sp. SIO4C1]|nr:hypothetical protein [Leptolyngbya sp. SIO4C1]
MSGSRTLLITGTSTGIGTATRLAGHRAGFQPGNSLNGRVQTIPGMSDKMAGSGVVTLLGWATYKSNTIPPDS